MLIAEYQKQVKEQLELLETMRNTASPYNILEDILTELLEVGELALGKNPKVFFHFVSLHNWGMIDFLYKDEYPWGALISCCSGKIISLVQALTHVSCFLRYRADGLTYQPKKKINAVPLHFWSSASEIARLLDVAEDDLHIPSDVQECAYLWGRLNGWCDADAEQFLRMNLAHLRSWIEISNPSDSKRPPIKADDPLYSVHCDPKSWVYCDDHASAEEKRFMKDCLSNYLTRMISITEDSTVAAGFSYDAIINMLLVYMDSISFPTYPAYDQKNRKDAPQSQQTVTLKPTIPITPDSIRQWETRGTIKPRASAVAHVQNREKLLEKMENNQVPMKVLRDLLAELAKDAYRRRQLHAPIKSGAKPVILSVDEFRRTTE